MNLKKYLKTEKAWGFIEYAVVFVAITAAVVLAFEFIGSTKTDSGRVQGFFKEKVNTYIAAINNSEPDTTIDNPPSSCQGLRLRLDQLNAKKDQLQEQKEAIKQLLEALNQQLGNASLQGECNKCLINICETNYGTCTGGCNDALDTCRAGCMATYSWGQSCYNQCDTIHSGCMGGCEQNRTDCRDSCKANNSACRSIERIKRQIQLEEVQREALNNQIEDLDTQIADIENQIAAGNCG
jgi:prefoldin subunit 5